MSRPHIEFVQCQRLPWEAEASGLGLERKVLSQDSVSGAMTLLQRVPPGFQYAEGTPLAANEEFYVLDGAYYLNGYEYAGGCYGFYPAGYERREIYSPGGAVLLRFFDAAPRPYADDPDAPARADGRPALPFLDSYRMTWDKRSYDIRLAHLNPARKILRVDPRDQQKTFLFMTAPQTHPPSFRGALESHPTPEEAFLIAGDLVGPHGTMLAGAYFWRPPGIPHGPFGSRAGSLSLIRFVGGAHENRWSEHQAAFTYAPEHRPVLPAELERYGEPLSPPLAY